MEKEFNLHIKTLTGKTYDLKIKSRETVCALKTLFENETGIPID